MKRDLILFTSSFPFGAVTEGVFVSDELPALCAEFDRVIIVPEVRRASTPQPLPDDLPGIILDCSRVNSPTKRFPFIRIPRLFSPGVIRDLWRSRADISSPSDFLRAWSMADNRRAVAANIHRLFAHYSLDPASTLLYTFWWDHITEAAALAIRQWFPEATLVSCAHGHDIYDTRRQFRVRRFRDMSIATMARLYTASPDAARFAQARYPQAASRINYRILGSRKSEPMRLAIPHPYSARRITIMSVSRVHPGKRVHLNLQLMIRLARRFPAVEFKWIHLGGTSSELLFLHRRAATAPSNLIVRLLGEQPNERVHRIYSSEPVDWFLLLSESEGGLPIAVVEALSYGVPAIVSDIPGCRDAVIDYESGLLVDPAHPVDSAVDRLSPFIDAYADASAMRLHAFERWQKHLNADVTRRHFARQISHLIKH